MFMDPPVACDTAIRHVYVCVLVCHVCVLVCACVPGGRGTTAHMISIQNKNRAEQEWGKLE